MSTSAKILAFFGDSFERGGVNRRFDVVTGGAGFIGSHLCEALLEDTGVAVLPGSAFGRPFDELSFRLAYVDFDGARALVAARGIGGRAELTDAFLRNYCHNVVQGVDRTVVWLKKTTSEKTG